MTYAERRRSSPGEGRGLAMRTPMRSILTLSLISLLLGGCGDDDAGLPDAGSPADQCVSASDQAILDGFVVDGGTGLSMAMNDLLRSCAYGCDSVILGGDLETAAECMNPCYEMSAIAGLSPGCQDCWTSSSICGGHYCAVQCLGSDPAMCEACVNEHCTPGRDYCTGL